MPMGCLCAVLGMPMGCAWFGRGMPVGCGNSIGCPWGSNYPSMGSPRAACGGELHIGMGCPLGVHGLPTGCPWVAHGLLMGCR